MHKHELADTWRESFDRPVRCFGLAILLIATLLVSATAGAGASVQAVRYAANPHHHITSDDMASLYEIVSGVLALVVISIVLLAWRARRKTGRWTKYNRGAISSTLLLLIFSLGFCSSTPDVELAGFGIVGLIISFIYFLAWREKYEPNGNPYILLWMAYIYTWICVGFLPDIVPYSQSLRIVIALFRSTWVIGGLLAWMVYPSRTNSDTKSRWRNLISVFLSIASIAFIILAIKATFPFLHPVIWFLWLVSVVAIIPLLLRMIKVLNSEEAVRMIKKWSEPADGESPVHSEG